MSVTITSGGSEMDRNVTGAERKWIVVALPEETEGLLGRLKSVL